MDTQHNNEKHMCTYISNVDIPDKIMIEQTLNRRGQNSRNCPVWAIIVDAPELREKHVHISGFLPNVPNVNPFLNFLPPLIFLSN